MSNSATIFGVLLIHGVPALRALAYNDETRSCDGATWDRIESPKVLASLFILRRVLQQFDQTHWVEVIKSGEIDALASKVTEFPRKADLNALLSMIKRATISTPPHPSAFPSPIVDKNSSSNAWERESSKGSPVFASVGMQYLVENQGASHGNFMHNECLSLDGLQPVCLSQRTLAHVMELWMKQDVGNMQLAAFSGSHHPFDIFAPYQRVISRLSETLIIKVDGNIATEGIEKVDFGPWTSFHPISKREAKIDYGMWKWKEGTSILDFQVSYNLIGCIIRGMNGALWVRSAPSLPGQEFGDWTVYSVENTADLQSRKSPTLDIGPVEQIGYLVYSQARRLGTEVDSNVKTETPSLGGAMAPSTSEKGSLKH